MAPEGHFTPQVICAVKAWVDPAGRVALPGAMETSSSIGGGIEVTVIGTTELVRVSPFMEAFTYIVSIPATAPAVNMTRGPVATPIVPAP